jgi:hypothetical protein
MERKRYKKIEMQERKFFEYAVNVAGSSTNWGKKEDEW